MAPRGIGAFIVISSLIMSMTVLGGIGYYASLGVEVDAESHNEDVQRAAEQLDSIEFGEDRSDSILEGPLAAITNVVAMFQVLSGVLYNTSGILQLLFGLPETAADMIELTFRLAMVITLLYLIRSGSPV